jgi:HEAT repeat protein
VRAIAGTALGARLVERGLAAPGSFEDQRLLLGLLEDDEPFVEASACLALGQARIDAARTDLLVRARVAEPSVRAAALLAIGMLGGDFVLEALVLGASASESEVRRAAAEGLVALEDAKAAPLLVSMLGRGRSSEVFEPARKGLVGLGQEAWPELERAMNSPVHRARREATLMLSAQGLPRSAGVLIGLLEHDREDEMVAEELAILTCIDFREADDPVFQWDRWWKSVVKDTSLVWLTAAMERRSVQAPPISALQGVGRLEGALFLLEVMNRPERYLSERGRRELSRMLDRELEPPSDHDARTTWLELLRSEIVESYDA